jgi:hypothetical protein
VRQLAESMTWLENRHFCGKSIKLQFYEESKEENEDICKQGKVLQKSLF